MVLELLRPDWPVAGQVGAFTTTRKGGTSVGDWAALNLASHVGDNLADVLRNRELLIAEGGLPESPQWLQQVHGTEVADLRDAPSDTIEADASVTAVRGRVCAVLTADCLPVFFASRAGDRVGVAHAGWRGLASGVLENSVAALRSAPESLCAWLGPAIGPDAFEVGENVLREFVDTDAGAEAAFRAGRPGHWYADLYALARRRLERLGVGFIGGGAHCTFSDPDRFYSYRRDSVTGRMASVIWMAQ